MPADPEAISLDQLKELAGIVDSTLLEVLRDYLWGDEHSSGQALVLIDQLLEEHLS